LGPERHLVARGDSLGRSDDADNIVWYFGRDAWLQASIPNIYSERQTHLRNNASGATAALATCSE